MVFVHIYIYITNTINTLVYIANTNTISTSLLCRTNISYINVIGPMGIHYNGGAVGGGCSGWG